MGVVDYTSKLIVSNSVDSETADSCISYAIFDNRHDFKYRVENNVVSISNGVFVNLI